MKTMHKALCLCIAILVVACNSEERRIEKDKAIFFDYSIKGEEDKAEVTCMFQYKYADPDDLPVLLESPGTVELDGETIKADSAKLGGVFYEIMKPQQDFKGSHTIVFTDDNGQRQYGTEFEFMPFTLLSNVPARVQKKPFGIKLSGLANDNVSVRLTITDTSFLTNDINEVVKPEGGEIKITQRMLDQLKAGPIFLELFREDEKMIHKGKNINGKILLSYGLRREFELIN